MSINARRDQRDRVARVLHEGPVASVGGLPLVLQPRQLVRHAPLVELLDRPLLDRNRLRARPALEERAHGGQLGAEVRAALDQVLGVDSEGQLAIGVAAELRAHEDHWHRRERRVTAHHAAQREAVRAVHDDVAQHEVRPFRARRRHRLGGRCRRLHLVTRPLESHAVQLELPDVVVDQQDHPRHLVPPPANRATTFANSTGSTGLVMNPAQPAASAAGSA
jgi:hypothetical protein